MEGWLASLFATAPGAEVGVGDFLLRLLIAWLAGQAIGWFYSSTHGVLSYSQTLVHAIVLLSMVVAMIMCVVGDTVSRAFALGAALAIIRFRTPVKDARDTVFLFLAVAVGMAAGAGMVAVAMASTALLGGVAMFLSWSSFGSRSGEDGVVRMHFAGDADAREAIGETLRRHCRSFQLASSRTARPGGPEELTYDVHLRHLPSGDALVRELVGVPGVTGVSLLPQARVGEA